MATEVTGALFEVLVGGPDRTDVTAALFEVLVGGPDRTDVTAALLEVLIFRLPDGGHLATQGLLVDAVENIGLVAATGLLVDAVENIGLVAATGLLIEAVDISCGKIAVHGLLVDAVAAPGIFDVRATNTKVEDLIERIRATEQGVHDLLDSGEGTTRDLQGFQAALTGYREEIAACRAVLDLLDVRSALLFDDSADLIRLWQWERGIRAVLISLDGRLRAALELIAELVTRRPGRLYAVKTGDTLPALAARFLGSFADWRLIAEASNIQPGPLPAGTILTIPER